MEEGKIGNPVGVRSSTRIMKGYRGDPKKVGNIFDKFSSHDVDILEWLLDLKIKKVFGFANTISGNRKSGESVKDTLGVTLKFENGAIGTIDAAHGVGSGDARTEIVGKKGAVIIGNEASGQCKLEKPGTGCIFKYSERWDERFRKSYQNEIDSFIKSISKNHKPSPSIDAGLRTLKIVKAIEKSISEKKVIEVTQ